MHHAQRAAIRAGFAHRERDSAVQCRLCREREEPGWESEREEALAAATAGHQSGVGDVIRTVEDGVGALDSSAIVVDRTGVSSLDSDAAAKGCGEDGIKREGTKVEQAFRAGLDQGDLHEQVPLRVGVQPGVVTTLSRFDAGRMGNIHPRHVSKNETQESTGWG